MVGRVGAQLSRAHVYVFDHTQMVLASHQS
jgi:hypothetical protein